MLVRKNLYDNYYEEKVNYRRKYLPQSKHLKFSGKDLSYLKTNSAIVLSVINYTFIKLNIIINLLHK